MLYFFILLMTDEALQLIFVTSISQYFDLEIKDVPYSSLIASIWMKSTQRRSSWPGFPCTRESPATLTVLGDIEQRGMSGLWNWCNALETYNASVLILYYLLLTFTFLTSFANFYEVFQAWLLFQQSLRASKEIQFWKTLMIWVNKALPRHVFHFAGISWHRHIAQAAKVH